MKRVLGFIFIFICLFLTSCDMTQTNHKHDYIEGECSCGEIDPDYVEPHEHEFIEGKCACGEIDPNYTEPIDLFKVTFEYDKETKEVIETEGSITLPTPEKENFVFIGWYLDDVLFEGDTVSSDITLKAKWIEIGTKYFVYYDTDGGTLPSEWTRYYYYGTEAELPTPEKKYNEFLGWYLDEEFTDGPYTTISAFEYGNKLYYAKYLDKAPYKNISYELNGGELDNKLEKYISGESTKLSFPKKEGYYFKGWYLNENFEGGAISTIDETFDQDITLYAKWVERSLENATVAIYGDSISTFAGYIPDNFPYYYPQATLDVQTVGDTWWYKLYQNNNLNIVINNSISGSGVINGSGLAGYAGLSQKRVDLLIQDNVPVNLVIIYLGINDCKVGTDASTFKRNYKQMINMMYNTLGDVDIVICTLGASTFSYVNCYALSDQYNIAIRELSAEFNLGIALIDEVITEENKEQYMANMLHPNKKGMEAIYGAVMNALDQYMGA